MESSCLSNYSGEQVSWQNGPESTMSEAPQEASTLPYVTHQPSYSVQGGGSHAWELSMGADNSDEQLGSDARYDKLLRVDTKDNWSMWAWVPVWKGGRVLTEYPTPVVLSTMLPRWQRGL